MLIHCKVCEKDGGWLFVCDRGGCNGDRKKWVRYAKVTPRPGVGVSADAQRLIDQIKTAAKKRRHGGKVRSKCMYVVVVVVVVVVFCTHGDALDLLCM